MELAGEDGSVLELMEGHPLVLGRVAGLSHHDGSVSRHHVVIELLRPSSRKGKEVVGQSLGLKLQVQVVGRNPICIVNQGREGKGKPDVKFLSIGQKDWLIAGDKISLSIKRPFFYELRFEGRSSPNSEIATLNTKANFNGLENAPDRNGEYDKFAVIDEEKGIAEAVARRQRRKTEREEEATGNSSLKQQHRTSNVGPKEGKCEKTEDEETMAARDKQKVMQQASAGRVENGDQAVKKQKDAIHMQKIGSIHDIDPVTEFGFIVEGSEFSAYEKLSNANKSLWRSEIGENKGVEDGSSGDEQIPSGRVGNKGRTSVRKPHISDDAEWGGDNETEQDRLKIESRKKDQTRMETRRTGHKLTPSKKDNSEDPSVKPSKKIREESDEDSSASSDSFIVDDEDPSEEDEEDEHDVGASTKGGGKSAGQSQKPECRYGSQCYRKNAEHLAQFYHPSA